MENMMTIDSKEFLDIMKSFEMTAKKDLRTGQQGLKRADRSMWKIQVYYVDGKANEAFKMFHSGYSCGRNEYLNQ